MTWFDATILGLLQGVTEFLPISSSGHLALARVVLDFDPPGGALVEVMMHLGTALSVIVVYNSDMVPLVRAGMRFLTPWSWRELWGNDQVFRLAALILLSAVPVAVVGLTFRERIESLFDDTGFVGAMLILTGCVLLLIHRMRPRAGEPAGPRAAIAMGLAQAAAILPGVSRSGSTIAAGLAIGASRESVARFAFLMSLVPILGGAIIKIGEVDAAAVDVGPLILGTVLAFASGIVALKVLLRFVARGRMAVFAPYCLVVGLFAVLW